MAKIVEPYEEDDFLLEEEQNSFEEQANEDEDIDEPTSLKVRPRPARASLTHSAIKSEILKMNKQQNRQDSPSDDNDEYLSRSARKRKKRREKVLEERRASGGRGENFEDDLNHFKSIPISRRRSSVLPLQTFSIPNHNNDDGLCSKLKCFMWIILVVATLIGLVYVWPTVAELDSEVADQANTQASGEQMISSEQQAMNEVENGEQIMNQINKLDEEFGENREDDQIEKNQEEEESMGTLDYISSFFALEQTTEPTEDQVNEEENNQNEVQVDEQVYDEQTIEPTATTADDDQADEGLEEAVQTNNGENDGDNDGEKDSENDGENVEQINVTDENLVDLISERYQSSVHEDNLEEEKPQSCVIGGLVYNNLDNEQCNLLQVRQHQLEEQLREQEQLIRQEQQVNENNDEQFYFF